MEGRDKSGDTAPCSFGYSFFALCFLVSVFVFASTACHHPAFFRPLWAMPWCPSCSSVWGSPGVPMNLCCSFDQGKCGSLGRYPELFLVFHNQWQNSDGTLFGDTHKLIRIFLSSVVSDSLNSYNTESFLTIVTFFIFRSLDFLFWIPF